MIGIRDYLIEVVFNNVKDNIKIYLNNNDKYFKELRNMVNCIDKDETLIKFFNDNTEPLIFLTEEILKEMKRLPFIYDLRDGC